MKHLIITQVPNTERYGCLIDANPQNLSDFRDYGDAAEVVLSVPVSVAVAAPELLAACKLTAEALECVLEERPPKVPHETWVQSSLRKAIAAIRKAEGGGR